MDTTTQTKTTNAVAIYTPAEFAQLVGVSVKTLHRWDASGQLPARRRPSGHRFYTDEDYKIAMDTDREGAG
jgi:predicted site-specific integrase-resolvase